MSDRCLYVSPDLAQAGTFADDRLAATTERHKLAIAVPPLAPSNGLRAQVSRAPVTGVMLALSDGFITRHHLSLAGAALGAGKRVWLHWPREDAVECVDRDRLRSLWHLWGGVLLADYVFTPVGRARAAWPRIQAAARWVYRGEFPVRRHDLLDLRERQLLDVKPVPWSPPPADERISGCGLYLRTDFWNAITSGGSYGHTCYVAKELAARSEQFACAMANRYPLLDAMQLRQVVLEPPMDHTGEDRMVTATEHYLPQLRAICQAVRPAFIYERLCLGNVAGALLSREFRIPYIVEYNGSEISMAKSFDGSGYFYEDIYLAGELLAFRQATAISVVSEPIKGQLVDRGVDASRILVNPNGADVDTYAPACEDERARLRAALGFAPADVVVGFTGTFGGWHGVDVLAAALPRVCAAASDVRFLLIGDGSLKHLVDGAVLAHGLESRVTSVGRVPQDRGATLLKACDIFLSPHSSHMVDSRFFGSPTKVFEYMATGGAIVASDLEQIGVVLSPSLRPADLARDARVTDERAVLCTPGDVDQVVDAVVALAARRDLRQALGANARRAVVERYSWRRHVERLLAFVRERHDPRAGSPAAGPAEAIATGDAYKDQVQFQWDNNPVGSQHASGTPHTLEWFLEVEAHRYGEYAPWMRETMEFDRHRGEEVLEIGGGIGTDLAQFAKAGARVTDVDLSSGHLALARENFRLRRLEGTFIHHDAETLPFADNAFDLVYSNGVIHHTPHTERVVAEIHRVLKPGGLAIVMVYAENSLHYWRNLMWGVGLKQSLLMQYSMGEVMSRVVERTANDARPLVKVYTRRRLHKLFGRFVDRRIVQRQMEAYELPASLTRLLPLAERTLGWNLVIKARKPR